MDIFKQISDAALGEHNILTTGQSGTGKSQLIMTLYSPRHYQHQVVIGDARLQPQLA